MTVSATGEMAASVFPLESWVPQEPAASSLSPPTFSRILGEPHTNTVPVRRDVLESIGQRKALCLSSGF